jgi:hypothetical protein
VSDVGGNRIGVETTQSSAASSSNSSLVASSNIQEARWWSDEQAKLFTQWAAGYEKYSQSYANPYFDYFFTGQDIRVTIDGLTDNADTLPIYAFGYNIQQQKVPLYGFWTYTYDAMLRGTRIVSGAFSIVSVKPYLLTEKIAKATAVRAKTTRSTSNFHALSVGGLSEDDVNIDKYWRRNYDTNLEAGQQHLFSVHPPFNFVIEYGIQEVSLTANDPDTRARDIQNVYQKVDPWMTDVNERLVPQPSALPQMKILLENIELTSKQVEYNVDGDPLMENYTFIARDERLLGQTIGTDTLPMFNPSRDTTQSGVSVSTTNNTTGGGGGGIIRMS